MSAQIDISIADGGEPLYQWDTRRHVSAPGAKEIHAACRGHPAAYEVAPGEDGLFRIPDELLQTGLDVAVWAWDGERTMAERMIPVRRRARPDGYAYEPTDVATMRQLAEWVEDRIAALEGSIGELVEPMTDEEVDALFG